MFQALVMVHSLANKSGDRSAKRPLQKESMHVVNHRDGVRTWFWFEKLSDSQGTQTLISALHLSAL